MNLPIHPYLMPTSQLKGFPLSVTVGYYFGYAALCLCILYSFGSKPVSRVRVSVTGKWCIFYFFSCIEDWPKKHMVILCAAVPIKLILYVLIMASNKSLHLVLSFKFTRYTEIVDWVNYVPIDCFPVCVEDEETSSMEALVSS